MRRDADWFDQLLAIIVGFSNYWGIQVNAQNGEQIIRFDNLCQYTDTVGEYAPVKAKAVPFESSNAKGVLRPIASLKMIGDLAKGDAAQIKLWTAKL